MAFHRDEKSSLVNKLVTLFRLIKMRFGTSLVVQWLGKALPVQRVQLRFLVEELGPHMPRCQKTKPEWKQCCGKFNKEFKKKNGPHQKNLKKIKFLKKWRFAVLDVFKF